MPVPVRFTVEVEESLLFTVTVPDCCPAACGANTSVTGTGEPGCTVKGRGGVITPKSALEMITEFTVSGAVPEVEIFKIWLLVCPIATLPKENEFA